jgi:hypothetical protein
LRYAAWQCRNFRDIYPILVSLDHRAEFHALNFTRLRPVCQSPVRGQLSARGAAMLVARAGAARATASAGERARILEEE